MTKQLSDMNLEELWHLFPISLSAHQPCWQTWYEEERQFLCMLLPDLSLRINHIGSTAIKGIWAKPIIDILIEAAEPSNLKQIKTLLIKNGYICMSETENRISLNKGYTEHGFAERVFHIHLRLNNDHDEIYFRDYLNKHFEIAKEYEQLKLKLWKLYEFDRDGYTLAKTNFVSNYTRLAKEAAMNNEKGDKMKIVEIMDRSDLLIEQLMAVWENSVSATHLFLSAAEISKIKEYVPQALLSVPHLIVMMNDCNTPIAFMGIAEKRIEMLFILNEERSKGIGKRLLQLGIDHYAVNELTVNEQNPQAVGFYEHMGFQTYKRSECDEQGNPYPLLIMRLIERGTQTARISEQRL